MKETTTLVGSADRLTVASYNAENLDPNDGAARFNTIAQEIVTNLKAPDIVALQEVQDNDGPGNAAGSTVKAANVTLQMLVDALNAAAPAGVQYAFIDNPFIGDDTNGGEGGGNIRTAFLYRTDRVDFVDGSLRTIAANGDCDQRSGRQHRPAEQRRQPVLRLAAAAGRRPSSSTARRSRSSTTTSPRRAAAARCTAPTHRRSLSRRGAARGAGAGGEQLRRRHPGRAIRTPGWWSRATSTTSSSRSRWR